MHPSADGKEACPLCGSRSSRVAYIAPRWAPHSVAQCAACGLFFLSPRPDEAQMARLYGSDDYFERPGGCGYGSYAAEEQSLRATFRRLLATLGGRGIIDRGRQGRLLEVGCGYGYLLDESRDWFRWREGTDFSVGAVERARRVADRVTVGGVDTVPLTERFDLIVANHVIEHVTDPVPFVRSLVARLAPGGWLVLSTPDMGSPWRRLLGRRWPSFKIPEHVLFFDRRTLGRVLREAALDQLAEIPYAHAFTLSLVGAKIGVALPRRLGAHSLWLPGTTVAMAGRIVA